MKNIRILKSLPINVNAKVDKDMKMSLPPPYENLELKRPKTIAEDAENAIKFLFSNVGFSTQAFSKRFFNAVFKKKDRELLDACLQEFQKLIFTLFKQIEKNEQNGNEELFSIILGWILALLPFMEPQDRTSFFVPQKISGKWQLSEYEIEHVPLTPAYLGTPMLALGLTSKSEAEPLLLFMGTPQPTATGHLLALWTDFVPGFCVGELAYTLFAHKQSTLWLEKVSKQTSKKVKVYGKSLGATLSLLTMSFHRDKISEVHAFCPALPFKKSMHKSQEGNHQEENVKVCLYFRERDPVFYVGSYFEKFWQINCIKTDVKQNFFFAHLRVCPAFSGVVIEKLDPVREQKEPLRKVLTLGHFVISIPIFIVLTALLALKSFFYFMKKIFASCCR